MSAIKLSQPFDYNGDTLTEIPYNTENLKAKTIINIINRLGKKGVIVTVPEIDTNVHLECFAKASGIPVKELERLSAPDMVAICGEMRSFLLGTLDEPETEEESN